MPLQAKPSRPTLCEVETREETRSNDPLTSAEAIVRLVPAADKHATLEAALIAVANPETCTLFIRSSATAVRRRSIIPDLSEQSKRLEDPATARVS